MTNNNFICMKLSLLSLFSIFSLLTFGQSDTPCGAPTLPVNASCSYTNGTTVGLTMQQDAANGGLPTCASLFIDGWYSFVAPAGGGVQITTQPGSISDGVMALYNGPCSSPTQISCNDDAIVLMPQITQIGLTPGVTYYIRFWQLSSGTGTFGICITIPPPPPANDNCNTASILTEYPYGGCTPVSGTVIYATTSSQANGCSGSADDDVWYNFTATSTSANISLSNITGSTSDMYFSVYSGACGTLGTALLCSDPEQNVVSGLIFGNTYYIRVYTNTAATSQTSVFDICVTIPPPLPVNDNCGNATVLTMAPDANCIEINGYVTGGTQSSSTICGGTNDDDVWYSFVATSTSAYISRDANFDSFIEVRSDCGSGAAGSLLCEDAETSQLLGGLTIGVTYFYRIYSWSATPPTDGSFTTCVTTPSPPPPNGLCADMLPICSDAPTQYFNNGGGIDATISQPTNNYDCLSQAPNPVWYYIKIANGGNMSIDLTGSEDVDFALWGPYNSEILAKAACGALPLPIACSYSGLATEQINHAGCLAGQIYILLVTNYANIPQNISLVSSGANTATTDCSIVTLPIELIDFTVKQAGMSVQVNWKTGSELNNDYFTVEKSMNGSIWSTVSEVKGAGTTNNLNEYSALDNQPYNGISYYRIKQTDLNGDFQYSSIEKEEFKGVESILVYPQPAKDKLTLVWSGFNGEISWTDFSGKRLVISSQTAEKGRYIFDVSQLMQGIYFIKFSDGNSVATKKVIIQ